MSAGRALLWAENEYDQGRSTDNFRATGTPVRGLERIFKEVLREGGNGPSTMANSVFHFERQLSQGHAVLRYHEKRIVAETAVP